MTQDLTGESHQPGRIEVVCGSMFSGKTEELIRRMKRARFARQRLIIFKPAMDTRYSEEDGRYYIGLRGGGTYIKCNPLQIFQSSAYEVQYWMRYTVRSLGMLFTGKLGIDALSGPVGMANMVNDTYEEVKPYGIGSVILTMMNLLLLLSINVGVINLLPLPALDGGRLFFMLIEMIRRKPIKPKYEGMVHAIGLALLLILMAVVTFSDIMKLVK